MQAELNPLSLRETARRLDDAGIPWAVFAGAAASVYGASRPLTDIDILVPSSAGEQLATLFPEGEIRRHAGLLAIALPGVDLVAGLVFMDLDNQMLERLEWHEIDGLRVPVIPPEDNLLLKARLGRGREVGKHDWEDVQAMMAHLPVLDWPYLRTRAKGCIQRERLQETLDRLEVLWAASQRARAEAPSSREVSDGEC